jgi:hypothetical protein
MMKDGMGGCVCCCVFVGSAMFKSLCLIFVCAFMTCDVRRRGELKYVVGGA